MNKIDQLYLKLDKWSEWNRIAIDRSDLELLLALARSVSRVTWGDSNHDILGPEWIKERAGDDTHNMIMYRWLIGVAVALAPLVKEEEDIL